jgi:hypothetical protein
MGLGVARCAPISWLQKLPSLPSAASCSQMYWRSCSNSNRDRGKPHGSSPPTPPYVRVRIRRFGGLSYRPPVNLGIPSQSKKALGSAIEVPDCSLASTDRERFPPYGRQGPYSRPASAIQRIVPILVSTASRSQTAACAWSTPQDLAAPMASGIGQSSQSIRGGNGPTPRPFSPRSRLASVASPPGPSL